METGGGAGAEFRRPDTLAEALPNKPVPHLVNIQPITPIVEGDQRPTLLYTPPILGHIPDASEMGELAERYRIVVANVTHGYPDYDEYLNQLQQGLVGTDPNNLVSMGFSEGASMASRLGQRLGLPRERVLLVAPFDPESYKPSIDKVKARIAGMAGGSSTSPDGASNIINYLKKVARSSDKLYSASGRPLSKREQFEILNDTRRQWTCTQSDLDGGVVIRGKKDIVSSPSNKQPSVVVATAGHRLADFVPYLTEAIGSPLNHTPITVPVIMAGGTNN